MHRRDFLKAEVRAALGDDDAPDRFPEELQCGYTFGRKPAAP